VQIARNPRARRERHQRTERRPLQRRQAFGKVGPETRGGNLDEPWIAQRHVADPTAEGDIVDEARRSLCADRQKGAEYLLYAEPNKIASCSSDERQQPMDDHRVVGHDQASGFISEGKCDRPGRPAAVDSLAPECQHATWEEFAHATRCLVGRLYVDRTRCSKIATFDRLDLRTMIHRGLARRSCDWRMATHLSGGAVPFAHHIEIEPELEVAARISRRCRG